MEQEALKTLLPLWQQFGGVVTSIARILMILAGAWLTIAVA